MRLSVRIYERRRIYEWWISILVGIVLVGGFSLGWRFGLPLALAQAGQPRITSLTLTSVSANSARIDATFSEAVESRILYGPTSGYGKAEPLDPAFFGPAATQAFSLTALNPGTTYHYKVEIRKDATSPAISSADRTLTTKSGSASGGQLVITNIIADCINTQCEVSFSTSIAANVQMRWHTSQQSAFSDYTTGGVGELAGTYLATNRRLRATGLNAQSTYHYRLLATDQGTSTFLTNDLTLTTSATADDHTFTTGGCSDGTAIGQCSSATPGSFCEAGGNLTQRCGSQCGFNCPAGQTCNTTQQCVIDPALTGSPYQCNISNCYENSGAFKAQAPAGCYASWAKCTANTVLKVRKDRGCNLWLSCSSSVQLEAKAGDPAENLCLSLAACNSLSKQGQCNKYLPLGQCDNNPLRFCATDADCEAGGTCNSPDPNEPTRAIQNLTFATPPHVGQIANLSGNVVAGLDWGQQGGANVIQGLLPWQLMHQIGGNAQIDNADFESSATDPKPWEAVPEDLPVSYQSKLIVAFEDQDLASNQTPPDSSPNRVLVVQPKPVVQNLSGAGNCNNNPRIVCTQNSDCGNTGEICSQPNGQCGKKDDPATTTVDESTIAISCNRTTTATSCDTRTPCVYPAIGVQFAGAASQAFRAVPEEFYYGEVRVRATKGNPILRVQFGHSNYTAFTAGGVNTFVDVRVTGAWQRIGLGPIQGMSGDTRLAVVCADETSCNEAEYQIDDVQVKPVLQVNNDPSYLSPSCRLYPKQDSPSCEYTQGNIKYKGWRGYCLEHDSVTGTCLSWWPVDILKGESGVFGFDKAAGYADQAPLFYCAESEGNYRAKNDATLDDGYWRGMRSRVIALGNGCGDPSDCAYVDDCPIHGICGGDNDAFSANTPAAAEDTQFTEDTIYGIRLIDVAPNNNFEMGTRILSRDTSAASGAFAQRPYSAIWQGRDGNYISVWFEFDATSRKLKNIHVDGNDVNSGEGSFHWEAQFLTKEICTQLVQVVTPSGETQPFAARVSSQAYQLPAQIGYTRVTDLTPYGAVVPPGDFGDNPENWPAVAAEKPNTSVFSGIGQSRSGTPYACAGDCSKLVCNLDPNNDCSTVEKVRTCQTGTTVPGPTPNNQSDINGDGLGDGQCVGVGTAVTTKGNQDFSPTLDSSLVPSANPICSLATKTCAASTSVSGLFSRTTSKGIATTALANKCRNTIACNGSPNSCPGGTVLKYANVQNVQCSLSGFAQSCTGQCTLPATPTYQDASGQAFNAYFTQQYLRRLFTQTYGLWQLTGGRYNLVPNSNTPGAANIKGWNPPTEICPRGLDGLPLRPAFPQDYCAVPPRIIDDAGSDQDGPQFLTGTARQATITGGSGTVGIKFNTLADADQLPLKHIKIDWGDAVDTFAYPFAPRSDQAKPHVFSHVYLINPANPHCTLQANKQTVCKFPIKIQVQDNWGWCSDAVKVGNPDVADATPDAPRCHPDSKDWYNTGLEVVVEP